MLQIVSTSTIRERLIFKLPKLVLAHKFRRTCSSALHLLTLVKLNIRCIFFFMTQTAHKLWHACSRAMHPTTPAKLNIRCTVSFYTIFLDVQKYAQETHLLKRHATNDPSQAAVVKQFKDGGLCLDAAVY